MGHLSGGAQADRELGGSRVAVWLHKMPENPSDDAGIGDEGHHPEVASTAVANQRVHLIDPSDEIRPPSPKGRLAGGLRSPSAWWPG